jgi:tetratricopeptide (TPR) repeat protein
LRRVKVLFPLCLLTAMTAVPQTPQRVPTSGRQEAQGQLDSSESIFAVLAAINAAGYDAESDSPTNDPLRKALRDHLQAQHLEVVDELRRYVRDHRPKTAEAELSQYISYALVMSGPPDFVSRYNSQTVPPDVEALYEFTPLLVRFCREANITELWKQSQPYFEKALAQYQEPIARAVLQVNAYLRNSTSGFLGRRFQIYVDLLGAPNQVQTRSYVDDYFVVATPSGELPIEAIRHAYLHYLLDPLPLRFSEIVNTKRGLGDYALGSAILANQYKSDFVLLATECLIKAVESRMDRKPAMVEQALREGFVMTPAFADALVEYEKQEQTMRLYFPELVGGIDLKREETRLDHIDFVSKAAGGKARMVTREIKPPQLTGAAKTIDEAEKAYGARDLPHAKEIYLRALKETTEKPIHAKAYYGLARIAVLERDPELGDRLFRKVLELDPDAATKSWSLLYLARLADSQGDREQAQGHYKAALAVEGVPDSVRQAAEKGLKEAFTNKKQK